MYVKNPKENIKELKKNLRLKYRNIRETMPPCKKGKMDARIRRHLFDLPEYHEESTVFVYISKSIEVDTFSIVKRALADGKLVASQDVYRQCFEMEFYYIRSLMIWKGNFWRFWNQNTNNASWLRIYHMALYCTGTMLLMQRDTVWVTVKVIMTFYPNLRGVTVGICYTSCAVWIAPWIF